MSLQRYPEYKDSGVAWLGAVPEHWQVAPFKRLVEFQNGADHKAIEVDDGYPVYGSGGVFAYASDYLYDGESVLLGRKGTVDRPLHVTGKFWTVDTMYWTRIASDACGKFCYYAATAIPFAYYSTNTALPSMTQGALGAHLMAFPEKDEQQAIATFLDRETANINALITEQEKLLALLAEKRKATISHAVTKGLNPDAPMKDSGIPWLGEVPVHWEVRRLRHAVPEITVGIVVEPSKYYVDDGVPALRSLNVAPGRIRPENLVFISAESNELLAKSKLHSGDVVVVRSGQAGAAAVVPPNLHGCNCIDLIVVRKPSEGCERFLCWYLESDAAVIQFKGGSEGAIQKHFNIGTAMNLVLPWPNKDEQEGIADYLGAVVGSIDMLVDQAASAIALLKERRSALIAAAVTGQIDVRGAVEAQSV